jgi:formiminoglutamate deiminase
VAWTGAGFEDDVVVEVEEGLIRAVASGVAPADDMRRLGGVVFPGFVNTHSHVFHRLLRGHTSSEPGDFWSWRDAMYGVAVELDPDSYRAVAAATFREMIAAGFTSVAEFHYLHHQAGGRPYEDPNVMGDALVDAAAEAGIRLTVLDTCYLSAGFGEPPAGAQLRFADASAEAWAERVEAWHPPGQVTVGAAIHSVRAVDPASCAVVAEWAGARPLHVHLSEQKVENERSQETYAATPTQILAEAGALGPETTVVHATWVSPDDISLLARAGVTASICPTTERWLADGIGPSAELEAAGVTLGVGSDSQAVIDPFEEMRLLELHPRLVSGRTGHHDVASLIRAGTGRRGLAEGQPADLVEIGTTTLRTAGVPLDGLVFAATAADVTGVVARGRLLP